VRLPFNLRRVDRRRKVGRVIYLPEEERWLWALRWSEGGVERPCPQSCGRVPCPRSRSAPTHRVNDGPGLANHHRLHGANEP
jgi:hypothetical protein